MYFSTSIYYFTLLHGKHSDASELQAVTIFVCDTSRNEWVWSSIYFFIASVIIQGPFTSLPWLSRGACVDVNGEDANLLTRA